jgi:hypothetical protein
MRPAPGQRLESLRSLAHILAVTLGFSMERAKGEQQLMWATTILSPHVACSHQNPPVPTTGLQPDAEGGNWLPLWTEVLC